jgi:hypothetical protein
METAFQRAGGQAGQIVEFPRGHGAEKAVLSGGVKKGHQSVYGYVGTAGFDGQQHDTSRNQAEKVFPRWE